MYHVFPLKHTRGIRNVTLNTAKTIVGVATNGKSFNKSKSYVSLAKIYIVIQNTFAGLYCFRGIVYKISHLQMVGKILSINVLAPCFEARSNSSGALRVGVVFIRLFKHQWDKLGYW